MVGKNYFHLSAYYKISIQSPLRKSLKQVNIMNDLTWSPLQVLLKVLKVF